MCISNISISCIKPTYDVKTDVLLIDSLTSNSKSNKSILFVGNSLTYTNDLPKILVAMAKEKGITIHTEMLAYPNYALEDHWNDGKMQILIQTKKFDFVVVQQGPSSQNDGRIMLQDFGSVSYTHLTLPTILLV